ncbi:protein phosphatase 2C domain-containing protein [Janthinobacterium agaricidamnosum]|uniref:Protein phosphatase n=1 Tax=Janthinobacterium agaricidamnosum NBRC 102515 = DSM 9628 TaxID=1349767 RepID=W0V5M9_9BURK|nr:protein phosphatase 2C domain-containing protein [Janthinobacterium agaricidamnosum]CDG82658.1 hypothetical protein GJA_2022 [Janthinobacterium agaricidamnosum NBRC 102515 = DSM 9628]
MPSLFNLPDCGAMLDVAACTCDSAVALVSLENQDNLLVIGADGRAVSLRGQASHSWQVPGWPAGHVRLAVLDGMGGHGHGREAAEAAAAGLLAIPACNDVATLGAHLDRLHDRLQAEFAAADGGSAGKQPGTTLTLLELPPLQAPLLYHVGDSRLYEITAGQAAPLTIDHVPATTYAMHGLLGEQEWWRQVHGEHRAQISQAFILGNAMTDPQQLAAPLCPLDDGNLPPFLRQLADRRVLHLRRDALYLLATDGFWACAQPADWVASWPGLLHGRDAADAVDTLFDTFMHTPPPGLHVDNLSAIALRLRPQNLDETALPETPPRQGFPMEPRY